MTACPFVRHVRGVNGFLVDTEGGQIRLVLDVKRFNALYF